jgi:peptidyl-tRNA hydrolase
LKLQSEARSLGLVANSILDAGRTQIAAGTRTVLAIGPGGFSFFFKKKYMEKMFLKKNK